MSSKTISLTEKINKLDGFEYNLTDEKITNNIEVVGNKEGEVTSLILTKLLYISSEKEEITVTFKDMNMDATDDLKAFDKDVENTALFNIEGKVKVIFENCNFFGYQNEKLYFISGGKDCDITFKNCIFSANFKSVVLKDNANASFISCMFDAIYDTFMDVKDTANFKMDKCKARVDMGYVVSCEGESGGTIENSKFVGPFVKPAEKDVDKYEEENPNVYQDYPFFCINSESNGKIQVYKTDMSSFFVAVFMACEGSISFIDSKIKSCYTGLWLNEKVNLRMMNTQVENCYKHGLICTGSCNLDMYDSSFTKTMGTALDFTENTKVSLTGCKVSGNNSMGIYMSEEVELKLRECTLHRNKSTAIIGEDNSSINASKCSFSDNETFTILLGGTTTSYFDDCMFLVSKKNKEKIEHFHVTCCDNSKLHFESCNFTASHKEFCGFFSKDESDVYAKNCKFRNLKQLAILNNTSKIYIKDSDIQDIDNPIARNEKDAVLEMVGCDGKLEG